MFLVIVLLFLLHAIILMTLSERVLLFVLQRMHETCISEVRCRFQLPVNQKSVLQMLYSSVSLFFFFAVRGADEGYCLHFMTQYMSSIILE